MPAERPALTLVVPAYNEAARLPASLAAIQAFVKAFPSDCEIVVVVEKSTDGTLELARRALEGQANFRVIGNPDQRGKGHAVRTGMLAGQGEILFFTDADLSTPLEEIPKFLAYFAKHPDVSVLSGNRKHPESQIRLRQNPLRQRMGETFNAVIRLLSGIQSKDTQCGFKAFRRPAAQAIFSRQTVEGFAFDVEILLLAEELGFQTRDLPVQWTNSPDSKVRIISDSLKMLRDAFRIRRVVRETLRRNPA